MPETGDFSGLNSKPDGGLSRPARRRRETGYGRFILKGKVYRAHRAAWMVHHGPIPDGMDVCHHCDVRNCIEETHLFLGTQADNNADMYAKGRGARGEKKPHAKLTEADVRYIRTSSEGPRALARRFGVSHPTIRYARDGRTWGHV